MEKKYECKACGHDIGFDIVDNKIRCQCCHTVAGEMTTTARKSKTAAELIDSLYAKYIPRFPYGLDHPTYEPFWDSRLSW
jgi:hypothetical protein